MKNATTPITAIPPATLKPIIDPVPKPLLELFGGAELGEAEAELEVERKRRHDTAFCSWYAL